MCSIDSLALALAARGVASRRVSRHVLRYRVGEMAWTATADYDDVDVCVRSAPASAREVLLATANVADVEVVAHGAVGHTTCRACGGSVGFSDAYCRHCGARLRRGL